MAPRRGRRQAKPNNIPGTLYFGGSCRPNPGRASIGFVIYDGFDGRVTERYSAYLGFFTLTSNAAHYKALIAGLQHALWCGITDITAYGHSQIVCNQVMDEYTVDNPRLQRYYDRVWELASEFDSFQLEHIYFEDNSEARSLAREGFNDTFVDLSSEAQEDIVDGCEHPDSAIEYILNHRCMGYYTIEYILDFIQHRFPESYAAVQNLVRHIGDEMGLWCRLHDTKSLAGLFAIS